MNRSYLQNYLALLLLLCCSVLPLIIAMEVSKSTYSLKDIMAYIIGYSVSLIILVNILRLVFRSANFLYLSSVVSILALVFTSFQTIKYLSNSVGIDRIITHHILWLFYFIFALFLSITIFKNKKYSTALCVIMFLSSGLIVTKYLYSYKSYENKSVATFNKNLLSLDKKATHSINAFIEKPHIFYVILDSYSRQDALKEATNYSNDVFIREMEKKGFYNISNSYSNYNIGKISIASSLQTKYFDSKSTGYFMNDTMDITNGNGEAIKEFKNKGYKYYRAVINRSVGYEGCPQYSDYCFFGKGGITEFQVFLLKLTPLLRTIRVLFPYYSSYSVLKLDDIKNVFPSNEGFPIFSFIHLLQPHPPFIYKSDCSIRNSINIPEWNTKKLFKWSHMLGDEKFKSYYIENIKCINTRILNFTSWIEKKFPNSIVIIQGSNGLGFSYRKEDIYTRPIENVEEKETEQELSILNLIKIPSKCHKYLYSSMTPINTFRLVIGCLEGKNPRFLKDKLYKLHVLGDGKIKDYPYFRKHN